MRFLPAEPFHRCRGPAVGISFPQHRVDGAAEHPGKAGLQFFFGVVFRRLGIVRDGIALFLQLLDRRFQLRDGGADVGQFDDIGLRQLDKYAKFRQVIRDFLTVAQFIREIGDDAAGQRDVLFFEGDAGAPGVCLENGQQGVGGEGRGLINLRVNDLLCCHNFSLVSCL